MVAYTTLIRLAWGAARAAALLETARRTGIQAQSAAQLVMKEAADIWNERRDEIEAADEEQAARIVASELVFTDENGQDFQVSSDQILRNM